MSPPAAGQLLRLGTVALLHEAPAELRILSFLRAPDEAGVGRKEFHPCAAPTSAAAPRAGRHFQLTEVPLSPAVQAAVHDYLLERLSAEDLVQHFTNHSNVGLEELYTHVDGGTQIRPELQCCSSEPVVAPPCEPSACTTRAPGAHDHSRADEHGAAEDAGGCTPEPPSFHPPHTPPPASPTCCPQMHSPETSGNRSLPLTGAPDARNDSMTDEHGAAEDAEECAMGSPPFHPPHTPLPASPTCYPQTPSPQSSGKRSLLLQLSPQRGAGLGLTVQQDEQFVTSTGSRIPRYSYNEHSAACLGPAHHVEAQLAKLDDLKQLLQQRGEELKRPVMAISRSEAQIQEEHAQIRLLQKGLTEVEKKLKVLQQLNNAPNRTDDKIRLFTSLDACRESLLQQARRAEPSAFVTKDVIKSIVDFCTVKNVGGGSKPGSAGGANPDIDTLSSKPSGIPKFPRSASARDDQPPAYVDQAEGRYHQSTPSSGIPSAAAFTPAPTTPTSGGGGLRTPLTQSFSNNSRPSLQLPEGTQLLGTPTQHLQAQDSLPVQRRHSAVVTTDAAPSALDTMLQAGNPGSSTKGLVPSASDAVATIQAPAANAGVEGKLGAGSGEEAASLMHAPPSRIRRLSQADSDGGGSLQQQPSSGSLGRDGSSRLPSGIPSFKESTAAASTPKDTGAAGPPRVPRLRLGANTDSGSGAAAAGAPLASPSAHASLTSPVPLIASPRLPSDSVDTSQPDTSIFKSMSMKRGGSGGGVNRLRASSNAGDEDSAAPATGGGAAAAWRAREQGTGSGGATSDAAPGASNSIMSRISSFNSGSSSSGATGLARTGSATRVGSTGPGSAAPPPPSPGAGLPFKLRPVQLSETRSTPPPTVAASPVAAAREQLKAAAPNGSSSAATATTKPSPITAAAAIAKSSAAAAQAAPAAGSSSQAEPSPLDSVASEPAGLQASTAAEVPLRPAPARPAPAPPAPAVAEADEAAPAEEQLPLPGLPHHAKHQAGEEEQQGGLEAPRRITDASDELLLASPLIKHFAAQQSRRVVGPTGGSLPQAVMAAGHQVAHTGLISAPARYHMPARLVNSTGGVNGMDLMMMDDPAISVAAYSDEPLLDAELGAPGTSQDRDAWLRGRKRGPWGMLLRVVGLTTTALTVAAATGVAVFAAAALNSGLDELDELQVGQKAKRKPRRSNKGRKGSTPLLPFFPPASTPQDTLAAGRG